jgi:hypothetical protein
MTLVTPRKRLSTRQFCVGVVVVALVYLLFFRLNAWLFDRVKVSDYISWVFLPAAIRMLAVLLLGWAGVIGLYLGSLTQLGPTLATDPVNALALAAVSSLPCLVAARIVQRVQGVGADLAGMTGRQLLICGLAGGLASSAAHTLYFALIALSTTPLAGFLPMLVGDTVGMLLMLYLAAIVLHRLRLPSREE